MVRSPLLHSLEQSQPFVREPRRRIVRWACSVTKDCDVPVEHVEELSRTCARGTAYP